MSKAPSAPVKRTPFEPPISGAGANVAKPPAPPPPAPPAPPPPAPPPRVQALPTLIILERDFGFTLNGVLRTWAAGKPITARAEISELLANDAPARRFSEIFDV